MRTWVALNCRFLSRFNATSRQFRDFTDHGGARWRSQGEAGRSVALSRGPRTMLMLRFAKPVTTEAGNGIVMRIHRTRMVTGRLASNRFKHCAGSTHWVPGLARARKNAIKTVTVRRLDPAPRPAGTAIPAKAHLDAPVMSPSAAAARWSRQQTLCRRCSLRRTNDSKTRRIFDLRLFQRYSNPDLQQAPIELARGK